MSGTTKSSGISDITYLNVWIKKMEWVISQNTEEIVKFAP